MITEDYHNYYTTISHKRLKNSLKTIKKQGRIENKVQKQPKIIVDTPFLGQKTVELLKKWIIEDSKSANLKRE